MKMADIIKHAEAGGYFAEAAHGGRRDNHGKISAKKVEVLNPELLTPGRSIKVRYLKDTSRPNAAFHEDGTRTNPMINAKDIRRTWEEQERMLPIWKEESRQSKEKIDKERAERQETNSRAQSIIERTKDLSDIASDAGLEIVVTGGIWDPFIGDLIRQKTELKVKGLDDNEAVLAYLENLLRALP